MSLPDKDILELNELCNGVVEGTLTDAQKARLSHWLANSLEARQFYIRAMGVSASLYSYAGEMQSEAPDHKTEPSKVLRIAAWFLAPLAIAASIVAIVMNHPANPEGASSTLPVPEFVAQITGSKGSQWQSNAVPLQPGDHLRRGQRIELVKGFAEITFDCGAQVVLEGPASMDVKSAWQAVLNRGTLKASVPPEAIGFGVSNPAVQITDLGTEFTMSADTNGTAEVLVLKGEVEAKPSTPADRQTIVLRATESRRFESSGMSEVSDSEERFGQFIRPIALEHFMPPTDCVHWSFDETNGEFFRADSGGLPVSASDAKLRGVAKSGLARYHVEGRRGEALHFDGRAYVRAAFSGISDYAPHTFVFWVKVAKDAKLSNAYSMVAWRVNNQKVGSHPVHIGWNRNPEEGTVGVLRTDYGGGFAVGTTPLRDGQWHHIAVVLLPTENADKTMEVKQYVDGHLEGEGGSSPPGSDIFFQKASDDKTSDAVWLGCRLGIADVRLERFCGDMDELFIADRALEPREIIELMNNNALVLQVADAGKGE